MPMTNIVSSTHARNLIYNHEETHTDIVHENQILEVQEFNKISLAHVVSFFIAGGEIFHSQCHSRQCQRESERTDNNNNKIQFLLIQSKIKCISLDELRCVERMMTLCAFFSFSPFHPFKFLEEPLIFAATDVSEPKV